MHQYNLISLMRLIKLLWKLRVVNSSDVYKNIVKLRVMQRDADDGIGVLER